MSDPIKAVYQLHKHLKKDDIVDTVRGMLNPALYAKGGFVCIPLRFIDELREHLADLDIIDQNINEAE